MVHIPDISKDFILNKAVRDATNILLKPYMPVILSESISSNPNTYYSKYNTMIHATHEWISNSQDFLLKMATIAWDFLDVYNIFQNNIANETMRENGPDNNI